MKNLLSVLLFTVLLASACRNGADKKAVSTIETPAQIEQVEQESEVLEKTAKEIEAKAEALDAALNELDN